MSNAAAFIEEIAEKYPAARDFIYLVQVAQHVTAQRDLAVKTLTDLRDGRLNTKREVRKVLDDIEILETNCDVLFRRALAINHR